MLNKRKLVRLLMILSFLWWTSNIAQGESTSQISSTGIKGNSVQETRTIKKTNPSSTLETSINVDSLTVDTSQITSIPGESTAQISSVISSTGTISYLKGSRSVLIYTSTTVQETRTIGKINPSSALESSLKVNSLSTVTSQITSIPATTTSPTPKQESGPTFVTRPNDTTIEEGGNATFKCEILGYPQPNISWYKGNITLQPSASHIFSQNNNTSILQIINVTRKDSDIYICEAVNEINNISARATLDVQYQPEFVNLPKNETVLEGRNATFVCGALGNPPPIISWYKENTRLQSSSSDIMLNAKNETLTIINATRKDATIYNCTAKNKISQISTTATLDVQYQPEFVNLPKNETVLEGRNATFVCGALGNPPPIISWYKENTRLQSSSSDIMLNAKNETLTIINASRKDATIYNCTAKNKISQISTTATLDVQYQPEFVNLPKNETVLEGRNATFVCGALGNPPPIISWYKENTRLQSSSSDIMLNAKNETLTIINASRKDATIYNCTAKNKISQISTTATLDVQYVPTVELKIEHGPEIRFTETAKLICNVTSNPNSTIDWKKQNNDINAMNSSKYKVIKRENSSELLIYNLTRNDTANYTCFAKNKVGNHSKTEELIVLSPPDAPNNIVIKNITAYSIIIQWSSGIFDGNSPITNYSVEYRKEEGNLSSLICDGSLTNKTCVVNETEVYVTNLMAFTNYTFRVCSRNDIGEGSCDTANVRTEESVPDAPQNVQLIKLSFSKLRLSWTSPVRPNGVVTGYYVTWLIVKNDRNETVKGEMQEDIFNKTVTSFDIKDLYPFSVYNVTINAITKPGNGSHITLQERTNETFPGNPANVTFEVNSSTSINIRWNEPGRPNGIIQHYIIYWKLVKDDNNETLQNQATLNKTLDYFNRAFTITKLDKFSLYEIRISASTVKGEGGNVSRKIRTAEDVPDVPEKVQLISISFSKLRLSWKGPTHPNGVLIGYYVTWQMIENDRKGVEVGKLNETVIRNETAISFIIQDLNPFSEYNVTINAITNAGNSSRVLATERTKETFPDYPANVTASANSSTSIKVVWDEPKHPNGNIIHYSIYWQLVKNDNNETLGNQTTFKQMVEYSSKRTFTIPNLKKFSLYDVKISASTVIGEGRNVSKTLRTTEDVPDVPEDVNLIKISFSNLRLLWKHPAQPNGVITGYYVTWQMVKNDRNETTSKMLKEVIFNETTTSFVIKDLRPFSVYNVTINAITKVGNGSRVKLQERTNETFPDYPANVTVEVNSSTSINIRWNEPERPNGIIQHYRIYWKLVKDDNNKTVRNQTTSNKKLDYSYTAFTITGLEKFSWYEVAISASTVIGEGKNISRSLRTSEDVPDSPANVTVEVKSSTSVKVLWEEPEHPNGIIRQYRIYWKLVKNDNNKTLLDQPTSNETLNYSNRALIIDNLEKFSLYEIRVSALTAEGEGENVLKISRTAEDVPDAPRHVQLTKISFSNLRLSWTRPARPNGVVTGYYVTWKIIENDRNQTTTEVLQNIILNETTTSFEIMNLKAFSVYNVTVNAITKAGNGSRVWKTQRTNETFPDYPVNVTAKASNSTSLKVLWDEPKHPNGIILFYRIYWKLVNDDNNDTVSNQTTFNKKLDYSYRAFTITGLEKFRLYEVKISASTAEGEGGNVSRNSRTSEDVPDAPEDVQLIEKSFSKLRLSWIRPTHPNGVVTGYYVTWQMIENDRKETTTEVLRNIILNETTTSFEIMNLKAFSVYNVTVNAITKAGNGSRVWKTQRTNETFPDYPVNVTAKASNSTSLKVLWDEPKHPNGIILFYRIYWKLVNDDNNDTVSNQTTFNKKLDYSYRAFTITGLEKFRLYEVKISASTAEGEGGNVSRNSRTSEDVPDAPEDVQLIEKSFSKLRLSWIRPTHPNGVVTGYYVTWQMIENDRKETTTEVLRNIILNETTTSFEIMNLKAFSVYNVTVNAITKAGNGSRVWKTQRTNETFPDYPVNVTAKASNSTSLKVLWDEPKHPNGIILFYRIYWKLVNDDNNDTVASPRTFNKKLDYSYRAFTITGLEKFRLYEIKISASTAEGEGGNVSRNSRTSEDVPDAPEDVQLIKKSFSKLRLSWRRPTHPNGIVTGYYVIWQIIENDRNETTTEVLRNIILNETTTSFEIVNLKAFSVYNVTVNAITKAGNGSRVSKSRRTSETFPDHPVNVTAKANNSTSLKVLWDEPKQPKGIILYYRIYWKLVNDDNNDTVSNQTTFNKKLDYSYRAFTITGLEKYSWYEIKVSAFTRIGEGKNTSKQFRTAEDVPGPPVDVKLTNVSFSKLNLTWMRPIHPFGVITGYFVKWRIESKNVEFEPKQIKDEQATSFLIENLDPYTRYNVSVNAITSAGNGSTSVASHLTSETLPNASPENVELSDISPYKALVEWTPLNKRDWRANSITYTVKYKKKDNTKEFLMLNDSKSKQMLQNLIENTSYVVSVFARNIIGNGNSSQEVSFTTRLSTPEGNKTSNTILFVLEKFDIPKVRFYQILVLQVADKKQTPKVDRKLTRYYHNKTRGEPYITAEFPVNDFDKYENFVVGDEKTFVYGKRRKRAAENIQNGPLESGSSYRFAQRGLDENRKVIISRDWTKEVETVKGIKTTKSPPNNVPITVSVIVVLIIVALVVSAVLVWKKRRGMKPVPPDNGGGVNRGYDPGEVIAISDFTDHCRMLSADSNYLYSQEYGQIPRKIGSHTMHHALHQANREKNRYNNILCYDYTRVILTTEPSGADYINASFLGGFEKEKAYIACQGPLENTCEDFWRMIWENLTTTIVMVTGLEEGRRIKCHQYWPSSGTEIYGQFNVALLEEIELTDYTIRSFTIFEEGRLQERLVKQFHYTAWPDHGVPSSPSSLLNFVRKSSSSDAPNSGPMVVHCSAGVGRTGTYVVLDTQLKRMAKVKNIDVYGYLQSLRNQRLLMVQVEEQYVFIHDVLLEAIHSGDTEIQAEDYLETVRELMEQNPETGIARVEEEFQRLGKNVVPPSQFKAANLPCNKTKNRYANVLPYDDSRVKITLIPGVEGSDYVNANYIDGYMKKKAFIATQAPIPDTISDFWRMVWAQNSLTIVMLSKEMENARIKVHRYWPNKAPAVIGDLMVELMSEQNFDDYVLRKFKLTNTKEKASHVIRQYHYISWPDIGSPTSSAGMIDLIGQVERWQQQSGNKIITVHCSAGVGRTGVFCALSILIERLKSEHVIDVFQTVRMLRQNRPAMVQTKEQYEYCYTTVQEYLDSFDLYANFT